MDDHLFPLESESHLDGRSGRQQGQDTEGSGGPGKRTRGLADRKASSSTIIVTAAEGGKEHGFCPSGQVS